jgi:hypothetical protein
MKIRLLSPLLVLTLTILACSVPGLVPTAADTPTPAAVTESAPPPTPFLDIPPLTQEQLMNAEYRAAFYPGETRIIKLTDGKYQNSNDPTSPSYVSVTLGETIALGDLDRDGAADAVVTLAEHYGGTGVFVSLAAVMNRGGLPEHAASVMIDDRPMIDLIRIENGEIYMEGVIHGIQDPMCCPTFKITQSFQLTGNALVLRRFTSFTPDGTERAITIETPADGWEVTGNLNISGNFTIGPFENTLVYHVYDRDSKELTAGPLMVNSTGMGAPGTFSLTIDLTALNYAGPILVTVSENSMADGSLLVLDSVLLEVK